MLLSYAFFERLHFPCIRSINYKNEKTNFLVISIHVEVKVLISLFKKIGLVGMLDR
jgi:hypothetical protein